MLKDQKQLKLKNQPKKVQYFLMQLFGLKKIKKSLNLKLEEEDICLPSSLINHNQQKDFKIVQIVLILKKLKLEKEESPQRKQKNDKGDDSMNFI